MYTVGQVAKMLGLSRDTLKFYEEKGLLNPIQDEENGYRKYNIVDINEAITVNFYRDIDIEIKKIQEIKNNDNIDIIEDILEEKEKSLEEEIENKKLLLKRVKTIKEDCQSIKENLNKFTIREMKPIVVTSDVNMKENISETYSEILEKYDFSNRIKKAVNLIGLSRIVYFTDENILKERYVFYEKLEKKLDNNEEVFSYKKCIYIVIEVPIINDGVSVDENMAASITKTAKELGYETMGIAFINLLFNGYKNGQNIQYIEVYTPIK